MRASKILLAILTTTALLAVSASADARGYRGYYRHRGPGPVLGLVGGVIVGAATIATLPFALLADAARPGPPPPDYYGPNHPSYGPPPPAYDQGYYDDVPPPPPPRYNGYYGPPRGYYNGY